MRLTDGQHQPASPSPPFVPRRGGGVPGPGFWVVSALVAPVGLFAIFIAGFFVTWDGRQTASTGVAVGGLLLGIALTALTCSVLPSVRSRPALERAGVIALGAVLAAAACVGLVVAAFFVLLSLYGGKLA